jgi:hypothetical protein
MSGNMFTAVVLCWCLAASGGGDTRRICTGPGPSVVIIIVVDINCLLCGAFLIGGASSIVIHGRAGTGAVSIGLAKTSIIVPEPPHQSRA